MKKYLPLILVLLLLGCRSESIINIDSNQAKKLIAENNVTILDIRTPQEFKTEHIKKAINIDYYSTDFRKKLVALDKSKTYLIYCRSGNRSSRSLSIFKKMNFSKIYHLKNGFIKWKQTN